jgi:hypothetical protein
LRQANAGLGASSFVAENRALYRIGPRRPTEVRRPPDPYSARKNEPYKTRLTRILGRVNIILSSVCYYGMVRCLGQ